MSVATAPPVADSLEASRRRDGAQRRLGRAATLMAAVAELRTLAAPFHDAALDQALRRAEGRLLQQLVDAQTALRKLNNTGPAAR